MAIHPRTVLVATALAAVSLGCRADPTIKPANQPPVADARVVKDGTPIDEHTDPKMPNALKFDYSGSPITFTRAGSKSFDTDGTITAYHWLSGTLAPDGGPRLPDGGKGPLRWVPAGAAADWPADVVAPKVDLDMGIWAFSLWVVDNDGA